MHIHAQYVYRAESLEKHKFSVSESIASEPYMRSYIRIACMLLYVAMFSESGLKPRARVPEHGFGIFCICFCVFMRVRFIRVLMWRSNALRVFVHLGSVVCI